VVHPDPYFLEDLELLVRLKVLVNLANLEPLEVLVTLEDL
jgi:hypothetical protein